MTTDIVERLCACDCGTHCKSGCIQEKAADEIKRLRAALGSSATEAWAHMYNEIERLTAALQAIEHNTGATMLATNHGRRGDIANAIARRALEPKT